MMPKLKERTNHGADEPDRGKSIIVLQVRKFIWWLLSVVVVFVLLLVWQINEKNILKNIYKAKAESLVQYFDSLYMASSRKHLQHLAKPFSWALASEMGNGNISKIKKYSGELLKQKPVTTVMIVDYRGLIVSSTDKKYEGKYFVNFSTPYYLNRDSTVVNKLHDSLMIIASPIRGIKERLGTLIICYSPASIRYN